MTELEVKIAPEELGHIGPVEVTNAMFTTVTISVILVVFAVIVRRKLKLVPGRLQLIVEIMVNMMLDQMTKAFGSEKKARKVFPLFFTIFIFLIFANYFTIIPFVESLMVEGHVDIFSKPTAHYSLTIALAIIMLGTSHIMAIMISPTKYLGAFIKIGPLMKSRSFKDAGLAMIDIFLGFMEIIGEIAKLISVATRLFGNLLAGTVVIGIITALSFYTQFIAPLPFIALELLVGIVQAFVFVTLGILFMSGLANAVEGHGHSQTETPAKA